MASSPAVATPSSSFSGSAISPGHAKQAVFEHLAETPRLARVTAASHLEIRPAPATVSFGIQELDALTGGLPRGCLTEIVGPDSSGRTSVLVATLAAATQRGEICALIDATDSFHPLSAQAAGVDLSRLLWVRCAAEEKAAERHSKPKKHFAAASPSKNVSSTKTVFAKTVSTKTIPANQNTNHAAARQRTQRPSRQQRESRDGYVTAETYRGAPDSPGLRSLFQTSAPAPQQSARNSASAQPDLFFGKGSRSEAPREENFLDQNFSKSDFFHSDFSQPKFSKLGSSPIDARARWKRRKMEDPVERALRAADLLLQSGGFGMVVIDLAGVPIKTARRVPLTTWFRFRRVIESTPTVMLLIGEQACAQTCSSLGLKFGEQRSSVVGRRRNRSLAEPSLVVGRWSLVEEQSSVIGRRSSAGNSPFKSSSSSNVCHSERSEESAFLMAEENTGSFANDQPSHTHLLEGLHLRAEVMRARTDRKPMQSVTHFPSKAAWTG